MPRDGASIYTPPFPDVAPTTTIASTVYNGFVHDVAQDLNTPRPIVAGGTGATSADGALTAISGEKASQVVTNFDSHIWFAGSFYSATTATGEPVDGHAFSGIAYMADSNNIVVEARDSTDGKLWIRRKVAGVWSAWVLDGDLSGVNGDIAALQASKVAKAGDTMTGQLTLNADPGGVLVAATKQYVDAGDTAANANANNRVSYAAAQSLTANQMAQARANIDVTKKNYILNGALMVSQEYGLSGVAASSGFPVDQFGVFFANAVTAGFGFQQVALPTPGGSPNRLQYAITSTIDTSVAAGDYCFIEQSIEGLRCADLKFGTASAKTVTLQFGVRAPQGTYSIVIQNNTTSGFRSYVAEYVIAAGEANTDVVKRVTVPGDVTGTWAIDNTRGMTIRWGLMAGTSYQQAAGAWGTTNAIGSPNQYNFNGVVNNVFHLFDVSLTEGSVAPPFVVPDFASELAACQRYFESLPLSSTAYCIIGAGQATGTGTAQAAVSFKATKRAAPILSISSAGDFVLSGPSSGTVIACTAITSTNTDAGGAGLSLSVASGLTAGNATMLFRNNVSAAKMSFSARL